MIYRIFPIADTYIRSGSEVNYGGDELLVLEKPTASIGQTCSRILINFPINTIKEELQGKTYSVFLNLTTSECKNLCRGAIIQASNIEDSWDEGLGKEYDDPCSTLGASWLYRTYDQDTWTTPGAFPEGSTVCETEYIGEKTFRLDVTDLFDAPDSTNGIILKFGDETVKLGTRISFYSSQTHTVYRPCLEIQVQDQEYTDEGLISGSFIVSPSNLKSEYRWCTSCNICLDVLPAYPKRIYKTSSLYSTGYHLPQESYWKLEDEYAGDTVIPYSDGTLISSTETGSFFNLNMQYLEPERYYRLVCKAKVSDTEIYETPGWIFKVIK